VTTTHHDAAATAGHATVRGLWLDAHQHQLLLAALSTAAHRTSDDLHCADCDATTCTRTDHAEAATTIRQWRGLAQHLAAPAIGTPPAPPVIVYHPDAARAWLQDWAAAEFGIDEDFTTVELTIAGRLEELLAALADNAEPQVWATRPPLQRVFLWRTADGDGVDGGGAVAAELRISDHTILLATGHLGHDEFVDDEATSGIDAAVEVLGLVADLVNETAAGLLAATAPRLPNVYTVIGVWQADEPIPVGVIAGEHPVHDGDQHAFPHGLWATSVTAPDSTTAQQLGIDEMRQS
jgi:hypothetical protein